MIPGWTREKLDRLIEKVREIWTPPKDKGFWENLYCLDPGEHVFLREEAGYPVGDYPITNPRKFISQKLAYYGKKHGKKYAVRKVPGGVKVWRME